MELIAVTAAAQPGRGRALQHAPGRRDHRPLPARGAEGEGAAGARHPARALGLLHRGDAAGALAQGARRRPRARPRVADGPRPGARSGDRPRRRARGQRGLGVAVAAHGASASCRRSSSSSTSSRTTWSTTPSCKERAGLAMVLNADGFGTQALKKVKYKSFTASPRRFFGEGFKLFYREDTNLMTPRQVLRLQAAARRRGLRVRLPDPCLVVLVGATAAGKSDWARAWFEPDQIVSSDRLRAVVGARRARPAREPRRVRAARPDRGEAAGPRADHGDRHDRAGGQAPRGVARAGGGRGRARPRGRARHAGEGRARAQPRARRAGAAEGRGRAAARGGGGVRGARRRGLRGRPRRRPGRARAARLPRRPGRRGAPGRRAAGARVRAADLALRLGGQRRADARRRRAGGRGRRLHVACG